MIRRVRMWGVRDWAWIAVAVLIAVAVGWIVHEIRVQAAQVAALTDALADEQDATRARGDTPVAPDPDKLLADPRFRGPAGPSGPRGFAGRGVSSVLCAGGRWEVTYTDQSTTDAGDCTGQRGPRGVTGSPGVNGSPGADGVDGVDGADGQQGPAGPRGADGRDGRGIQSAECKQQGDGRWRWEITYTDNTVDDDAGPCFQPRQGPLD